MPVNEHSKASQPPDRGRQPAPRSSLLAGLAKTAIEAALDAELVEHLGYDRGDGSSRGRGTNTRNGARSKTVGTVFGPLAIDTPRDRWGSFEPLTVRKWQREVIGIDRLLLPLVAKGAPDDEMRSLLRKVYPTDAPDRTLARIASTIKARLAGWHERTFAASYQALQVHRSAVLDVRGQLVGFPIVSVIGVTLAPDGARTRELLAVHACSGPETEPPYALLRDLRNRGVVGVRQVACHAALRLRDVGDLWPGATVRDSRTVPLAI